MSRPTEHKALEFKLDAPPDDEGRFSGYAAVFGNVDLGNDVIEPGAFTKTLKDNPTVPILWAHDSDQPIGVSTSMVQDGKGLKVQGKLTMEVQKAREAHALMKAGAIKGMSIGYNAIKRSYAGSVRHLQEVALGEISPVTFPMNPEAGIAAVKSEDRSEALTALRSLHESVRDFLTPTT